MNKPIDFKELIIKTVKEEKGRPITIGLLYKKVSKKRFLKRNIFDATLNKLILDNDLKQIFENKIVLGYINGPILKETAFEGLIFFNNKGDGFVRRNENDVEAVYVNKKNTLNALNGDKVICCLMDKQKDTNFAKATSNLRDGVVLKVIERNKDFYVGEFIKHSNFRYSVKVDDEKFNLNVELDSIENLVTGHKILFKIHRIIDKTAYATVSKVIGHINDIGTDIQSIVEDYGVASEFNSEVIRESSKINYGITEQEIARRVDLRHLDIITIDPKTSKDLDDAICTIKMDDDHFKLYVCIADVSFYVKNNSVIDLEAKKRSTSVYLVNKVIPMLPHNLSNDVCSLNPNEDRLSMTCEMDIDSKGNFKNILVYPSIIHSKKRFAYEEVNQYFDDKNSIEIENNIKKVLDDSYQLFKILKEKREKLGYIEFDIPEPKIILDENEKIIDIRKKESGQAQNMIECFMVAANEAVTVKFDRDIKQKFIYRVHGKPEDKKIESFKVEAIKLNFKFDNDIDNLQPDTISRWLQNNKNNPNSELINMILLRTMAKAKYSTQNVGHFGLALENYTHFTSPIRRYPDLIVHRLYRMFDFNKEEFSTQEKIDLINELDEICDHATKNEIIATNLERDVNAMKFAEYMSDKIGQCFVGMVAYVTGYGIFIRLDNTIEGLCRIENIKDDFYEYDQTKLMFIGRKNKKILTLGTKVKITVIGTNKTTRKIEFEINEILS